MALAHQHRGTASLSRASSPRLWLLFALQLPSAPSNARVKTWRRLQQLGAVALKGSLYALPSSAQALEDFEWLRGEVKALKGQASIFDATSPNGLEDAHIVEQFRAARAADYRKLRAELKKISAAASRPTRRADATKALRILQARLATLKAIDFFSAPGRDEADAELLALDAALRPRVADTVAGPRSVLDLADYQQRVWVTRPRPGVDRMASAWLIARFIDREPRFVFAANASESPDGIPFDMYTGGFGHEGAMCTFEVLQLRFAVKDPAVRRVGEIVHDLDLKEEHFRLVQTPGVGAMVDGLQKVFGNDDDLLRQGIVMFDAVYRGLQDAARPAATRTLRLRKPGGEK